MRVPDPHRLAKEAVESRQVDKLLLGAPEYQYLPKWSPSPSNTDLTELLSAMYVQENTEQVKTELLRALRSIMTEYDGLVPVATVILFESVRKARGDRHLGLPLLELAESLSKSIEVYRDCLCRVKRASEGADMWPDGLYGELRRLSRNTEKRGGPSFLK